MADVSSSVEGYTKVIRDAFNVFVDRYNLSEDGIKIGVVTFSDSYIFQAHLTSNKRIIRQAIASINETYTSTEMIKAFEGAGQEFAMNGRRNVRNIVILVSDGLPKNIESAMIFIPQYKIIYNMDVCGVYIKKTHNGMENGNFLGGYQFGGDEEFMKFISETFCYVASDYKSLPDKFKVLDICT